MSRPFDTVLNAALAYARAGYPVFPVDPETKKPFTTHGFKDATTDESLIQSAFSRRPVGVAIATVGLVVVDVDDIASPWLGEEGVAEALASCPISRTPGGGTHHFFRRPQGFTGKNWNSEVALDIDLKTTGGYVVLPPTARSDGVYEWVRGDLRETPREMLPLLPDAINRHIQAVAERRSRGSRASPANALPMGRIPEGKRDSTLTSHAGRLRRKGMSEAEIAAELHIMNTNQCDPPLPAAQVNKIASSIVRYAPAADSQMRAPPPLFVPRLSFMDVLNTPDDGREVLIENIMRRGDIVNLIGITKSRKSMMVTQLAMQMAVAAPWLGAFTTTKGRTLIIDAEVGAASLRDRFNKLTAELGYDTNRLAEGIEVYDLRGVYDQAGQCEAILSSLRPGEFDLIIVDPLYRMLPDGTDENDNIALASFYRMLGHYVAAGRFGCFVVHHAPKATVYQRSITDAGAGAGAISRAADGQMVLSEHKGQWTLKSVFRGFPDFPDCPLERRGLLWVADSVVAPIPTAKHQESKPAKPPPLTVSQFAERFVTDTPTSAAAIVTRAAAQGVSGREAARLLDVAVAERLVHKSGGTGGSKAEYSRSEGTTPC